jgi:hypothetical protein
MVIDEKNVFVAALALPDAEEREAYLQKPAPAILSYSAACESCCRPTKNPRARSTADRRR